MDSQTWQPQDGFVHLAVPAAPPPGEPVPDPTLTVTVLLSALSFIGEKGKVLNGMAVSNPMYSKSPRSTSPSAAIGLVPATLLWTVRMSLSTWSTCESALMPTVTQPSGGGSPVQLTGSLPFQPGISDPGATGSGNENLI